MTKDDVTSIEELIDERAKSYTPEWRFDVDDPDIGSALAIVYARMMEQTVKKLTRIPFKNRVVFLNSLGADLLPAVPSEGYISMALVDEDVDPVEVPTGTALIAESDVAPEGMVVFETTEAMFATPSVVTDVITCDGVKDRIEVLYDRTKGDLEPFSPFDEDGVNSQVHELYFSHDTVLYLNDAADIELTLEQPGKKPVRQEILKLLADQTKIVYEYSTGNDKWERVRFVEAPFGYIHLRKEKDQPAFGLTTIGDTESYWLRARVIDDVPSEPIILDNIKISTRCKETLPDSVIGPEGECSIRRFLPFGERLDLYQEIYFGSEEILSKKGSKVTLSFRVDFARVPLDTSERQPFNWEWVMRRGDFKQDIEFDVAIESVVWEYFNGAGWTRLFPDNSYERIFSIPEDVSGQYQTIRFVVPSDMDKALVGAQETFFIRARILKISNLYKQYGNYVLPVVENVGMKYMYEAGQKATHYHTCNNLEIRDRAGDDTTPFTPFEALDSKKKICYFGFETPPKGSPIKVLFDIAGHTKSNRRLTWEYSSRPGFKALNPVDETDGLCKTGIITFTGGDLEKTYLFGRERYWIRVTDTDDTFRGSQGELSPLIRSIIMNTTKVKQITGRHTEFFRMEIYEKDKTFDLPDRNIYQLTVDVDELGMLDRNEENKLREEGLLTEEQNENGSVIHAWVRWQEVSDFYLSDKNDRHFVCFAREGLLQFGNGVHGRIPSPSDEMNIRVRYQTAGGDYTNLPPEAISHSEYSLGYINRVFNPLATTGGCDPESLTEGVIRSSTSIRHQNRAVVARDYEALARESSRDIRMVKCFSGYDDEGDKRSGAITLVVLGKNEWQRDAGFGDLKERIYSYMKGKINPLLIKGRRFFITEPAFVEVRLYLELTVENYEIVFAVRESILKRLKDIITPKLSPDDAGYEIGEFPNTIQIQNAISDIDGIVFIKKIIMNTYAAGIREDVEVDISTMSRRRYILPVNGEHDIVINANQ